MTFRSYMWMVEEVWCKCDSLSKLEDMLTCSSNYACRKPAQNMVECEFTKDSILSLVQSRHEVVVQWDLLARHSQCDQDSIGIHGYLLVLPAWYGCVIKPYYNLTPESWLLSANDIPTWGTKIK